METKNTSKPTPKKALGPWIAAGKCLCPQCRTGKMFKYPAWNWFKAYDMHQDCSVCGLHFEVEPGFFWGPCTSAMLLGLRYLWLPEQSPL